MAQRPPPFAALRALEAACRHRSYTAAAAELNVTHSAVSQAVRRLEEEVGAKLFHRRGANMEPATASLALARAYAEASQSVGRAMRRISESSPNSVTLRAPAQVARLWLAPRLAELGPAFPQLSLCVRTDGPGGQEADITLQSTPPRPGSEAVALSEGVRRAYASPAFLRRHPLSTPEALLSAPLLIEHEGADWAEWFAAAGVEVDGALHGVRFDDHTGLAIDAAVRGLGVTLAEPLCVHDAVLTGDLVVVCAEVETTAAPLWAVWPAEHPKLRLIEPVAAWLAKETDAALASSVVAHRELARLSA